MKKLLTLVLAMVMVMFCFTGCVDGLFNSDKKTEFLKVKRGYISDYDYDYSDEDAVNIRADYDLLFLDDDLKDKYPSLWLALENESKERIESFNQEFSDFMRMKDDYYGSFVDELYAENHATLRRADDKILSVLYLGSGYYGGAHGMYGYGGANYDVATGKNLSLSDVIKDIDSLPEIIEEEIKKYYSEDSFYPETDISQYVKENMADLSWTVDYEGITFYFNPYDIAPYAGGAQQVTILFDEYPDLMIEKYAKTPDVYMTELEKSVNYTLDLDGDGDYERIHFYVLYNEYDYFEEVVFNIDGREFYLYDIFGYNAKVTLVKYGEGKYCIYLETTSDNDYCEIYTYYLTPTGVENFGRVSGGASGIYDGEYWTEEVWTNPSKFDIQDRTYIFSTAPIIKEYYVDDKGRITTDDELYKVSVDFALTVKNPFEAEIVDEKTLETKGKEIIEAGSEVYFVMTDEIKWIYLKLSDGRMAKINVNSESWPQTVNGIDIEVLFDGIMFAG